MVEKVITSRRNVIDIAGYREGRAAGNTIAIPERACRHCGAALSKGEREDECSSIFNVGASRKFYAD